MTHPTVVPTNLETEDENDEKWAADVTVNGKLYPNALTSDKDHQIKALNEVWRKVPDFLDDIDSKADPFDVNVTLKNA